MTSRTLHCSEWWGHILVLLCIFKIALQRHSNETTRVHLNRSTPCITPLSGGGKQRQDTKGLRGPRPTCTFQAMCVVNTYKLVLQGPSGTHLEQCSACRTLCSSAWAGNCSHLASGVDGNVWEGEEHVSLTTTLSPCKHNRSHINQVLSEKHRIVRKDCI